MSILVEVENTANLIKARALIGAKSDNEVVELAIEKLIEVYEPKESGQTSSVLDEEYWEDLFSDPPIPSSVIDRALREEREDRI